MHNPTPAAGNLLMPHEVGARWAAALRRRYPQNTTKLAARAFSASENTVKAWLDGQAPQNKHMQRAIVLHGPNILAEVHAPGHEVVPAGDPRAVLVEAARKIAEAHETLQTTLAALRELQERLR